VTEANKEHVMSAEEILDCSFKHGTQFRDGRGIHAMRAKSIVNSEIGLVVTFWKPGDERTVENLRRGIELHQDKVVITMGLTEEAALILMTELAKTLGYQLRPILDWE